jgi:uncharacterized protein (UPF0335 family)
MQALQSKQVRKKIERAGRIKMTDKEIIHELVEKILDMEHEIKTLQENRKEVLDEYKDKIDLKVFNAALKIARIKAKLAQTSDESLDEILDAVEDKICVGA